MSGPGIPDDRSDPVTRVTLIVGEIVKTELGVTDHILKVRNPLVSSVTDVTVSQLIFTQENLFPYFLILRPTLEA